MTTDPRIADWTDRVDGAIKVEVIRMHHHKSAWDRVSAMLADNPDLPDSYWWEFSFETYAMSQASAVRRQADSRKDVNSLMRLMMDMRKGATALTKTWWDDTLWGPADPIKRMEAERQWSTYFGGAVSDHLDPAIPNSDVADLEAAAAKVKRYVDENIAHTSAAPTEPAVTLELADVHEAMETVDELFRRYYSLLKCAGWTTTTPVEQDDFYAPFRVRWMRPGFKPASWLLRRRDDRSTRSQQRCHGGSSAPERQRPRPLAAELPPRPDPTAPTNRARR